MICNNYRRNSKKGLCTSHGFSYNVLEKQILEKVKQELALIDIKKLEMEIEKNESKRDYEKILEKLDTEIKLINDNIDKMYVDKLNNKISEEMYERLFKKLKCDAKYKENEYMEIKEIQKNPKIDNGENVKKVIKKFLELKKLTPELMKALINKIEIHQNKQVDLYFNFKDFNATTQ